MLLSFVLFGSRLRGVLGAWWSRWFGCLFFLPVVSLACWGSAWGFARVVPCGCCRSCPLSGLFRSVRPSSFSPCFGGVGSLGLRVRFLSSGGAVGSVRLGGSSCCGRSPFWCRFVCVGLGFCSKPTKHNNRPDFNTCTDFGNRGTNPPCALRALWRGVNPRHFYKYA